MRWCTRAIDASSGRDRCLALRAFFMTRHGLPPEGAALRVRGLRVRMRVASFFLFFLLGLLQGAQLPLFFYRSGDGRDKKSRFRKSVAQKTWGAVKGDRCWFDGGRDGNSRPFPVAQSPMTLVILNMCVTSEGSMSLSCWFRCRARAAREGFCFCFFFSVRSENVGRLFA